MSHPVTPELLLLHDAGELDAAETRTVASHVSGCAECAARLRELRTLGALISKTPLPEPSALRRERVLAVTTGPRYRGLAWGVALAAAATLLLAIGQTWWPAHEALPPKPVDPFVARHRQAVDRLGRPSVEIARGLPDGAVGGFGQEPETGEETLARARDAVAGWETIAHVEALFPARVPEGIRFREARLVDGIVEVTFAGKDGSFTVFVGAGDGVERAEAGSVAGTAAGLRFEIVGDGIGAADLKGIRESLGRPSQD